MYARGSGPHSKLVARGTATGRNARFLAASRKELTKQLGGEPLTPAQRILVDRIAWLRQHVMLFDEKVVNREVPMSDRDRRSYLAFSNSLTRAVKVLGLEPVAPTTRKRVSTRDKSSLLDILDAAE